MKVVITDLDGTLLDQDTFEWAAARPAIERLKVRGIPLIFCTTKTRAEAEPWRTELENIHPFIVENGGALYIPFGYFPFPVPFARKQQIYEDQTYEVVQLGDRHAVLHQALREAAAETGCVLECFSEMTEDQIARRCHLSPEHAALAKRREYDEPFTILSGDTGALQRAVEKRGKKWSRGGRFYHITGQHDKALAVMTLLRCYYQVHREVVSIGLGDSPLDIEFLRVMDRAVIVSSLHAGTVQQAVPNSMLTGLPGAAGWNRAILEMIS
jgi:mannosyl-3-phosphoglycerate phosphatase